ncbi:hypothetical protein Tco_0684946 [Tanacetum coccineum]
MSGPGRSILYVIMSPQSRRRGRGQDRGRDTIQLEEVVSTIFEEYLLEFTSEYGIPESLHYELPGPEEPIVEFSEGKAGVYPKFFEFANYRAAKVSHFEIKCRVLNIIPTLDLFRVFYVPSYNSGWMSFNKRPGKNTPQCYTKPLDSLKNWNNRFFWVDERIFPTVVEWRTSAPKDKMPSADSYSAADVTILNTHRTPIQKQPELLLCLVGLSRSYFLGDDVYPTFLYDDDWDLFNLISALNPVKVKIGTRPHAAHEVPLLTVTASRVIEMEDTAMITDMGGTENQVHNGLSHEIPPVETATTTEVVQEPGLEKEVASMGPPVNKRRRKRGNDEAEANAPPKVLRKDHAAFRPAQSTLEGKSLASMGLEAGSTFFTSATQETPADATSVSDPKPLSYAKPQPHPEQDVAQKSGVREIDLCPIRGRVSRKYLPAGVRRDQQLPPKYPGRMPRHVAMGSQLRLRFEQEVRLLKKATVKIARRDQRIQARDGEIKRMDQEIKSLMTAEVGHAEGSRWAKNAGQAKELESLRVQFSDLQVSNNQLPQQLSSLQAQVMGEEKIKAAFKEFKKYEDDRVEQRCAEMDARLEKLSINFDEELYPHMLTAIAGRRWVIRHDMRLAVMKCVESPELRQAFANVVFAGLVKGMSEGLEYGIEHGKAGRDLAVVEAYDPEANSKSVGHPVSDYTIAHMGLAILLTDAATQTEVADKEEEPHPRLQRSISLPPFYNLEWK